MRGKLTDKQRETLKTIRRLRIESGLMPTQKEIADTLAITQPAALLRLRILARKGYVRLVPRVARGIVLL